LALAPPPISRRQAAVDAASAASKRAAAVANAVAFLRASIELLPRIVNGVLADGCVPGGVHLPQCFCVGAEHPDAARTCLDISRGLQALLAADPAALYASFPADCGSFSAASQLELRARRAHDRIAALYQNYPRDLAALRAREQSARERERQRVATRRMRRRAMRAKAAAAVVQPATQVS
jgi:hypothetical protein